MKKQALLCWSFLLLAAGILTLVCTEVLNVPSWVLLLIGVGLFAILLLVLIFGGPERRP